MEDALEAFARGEFLVVMDDEGRENEGDLIIAASHCTTQKMAWMIKHTRYISISPARNPLFKRKKKIKRLHLHCAFKGTAGGTRNPNDGGRERRPSPNRLYRHC
jgi:3,4-dihydroxy-2-butanone 4-phosphate synthase